MATPQAIYGSTELLQIADSVAREKGLAKESILEAMEQAIQTAGRRKYGHEHDIRAEIDKKTGEIKLYRVRTVVSDDLMPVEATEIVEGGNVPEGFNAHTQIHLKDARTIDRALELGDEIKDVLPPIDFGRVAAQTAKQVVLQKVRDAEREKQFEEFKDKTGEIISGTVKRVEYGNVVVDFGRTEAMIRRDELIPREAFRPGDRIRAYIADVRREKTGPQIFLSRTHPDFLSKLFAQEVPEIYDGIIEVKAVARDPGSRAKIAVYSKDSSVNPVLSCVGVRGSRVQAVVGELQGEKIDIIEWSPDSATFVVNALSSAEVTKVVIDETKGRIEMVVPDDQLSLAIGRRGQNVRLASQLTGWSIDILTEAVESERRADEFKSLSQLFVDALNVEEVIAHLLVTEGFTSVEEVAFIPIADLANIEGFDESVAQELHTRAQTWLESRQQENENKLKTLGMDASLVQFAAQNPALKQEWLEKLGEARVLTLDDFADLATPELLDILPGAGLSAEDAGNLIMAARASWFEKEEKA
ncbi:MAG: transcription termination/antitermination protein NusA [Pseudomonadota bacterium]|nr:transcription termination/antitermination protein NusA [Pseudomonadota bacterium]MDE3038309.1 transcription termination/antitermination protein NusA [Pseudomonadota bacterium]